MKNLPRPITKPAVQYAAHDFRNFTSTLFGTENSAPSFVGVPVVVRRAGLTIGILQKKHK
jgi:hypothetical protein